MKHIVYGIKYIIKTIVTEKTEATLNETLKPKYIEEKIREKSTHAINNLIKETETRARRIMEEHSTFFDWEMRANEAMENKDYEKAVEYFNSTIKKIGYIDDESYRNKKYYPTYFRLARAQFLSRNYKGALENLNNAKIKLGKYDPPIYPSKNPEVERYFMMNIIQGGIGKDTSKTEQKLEEFKKQDILPSGWLFAEMWSLSKDADVDEKVKSYINDFVPKYIGKDKLVEILKKQGKLP